VKSLQSVLEKMKRTGKTFEQLNDLLGLRVVCLFRSQIKEIAQIVGKEFQVVTELVDDKFETKDRSLSDMSDKERSDAINP
jgi:ppGpp synthetase/RelA/SpoT-type nucleotidyltranferase